MRHFIVVVALAAVPATALENGDVCTLKTPLSMTMNRSEGKVEATLNTGSTVEVTAVGDEGRTGINTGNIKGNVATKDLEAACAGTLQLCRVTQDLLIFEKNSSDTRGWRIKVGASLSMLRTGKVWAHVRIDDIDGFAKVDELRERCLLIPAVEPAGNAQPLPIEEVERGEGPGVLLLPFITEGAAPAGSADVLADHFFNGLAAYRPDVARLGSHHSSELKWNKYVEESSARARNAGLRYLILGIVGVEAESPSEPQQQLLISIALVDSESTSTLKAVRSHPTLNPEDPWVENTLKLFLPLLRSAPGARLPEPKKTMTMTTTTTTAPQALSPPTLANAMRGPAPWFANPWGYAALGTAAAAGIGSGVVGVLAGRDNTAANNTPPVDEARSVLRGQALVKSIAADSLAVVAGVATVTSVVVFASRIGMAE